MFRKHWWGDILGGFEEDEEEHVIGRVHYSLPWPVFIVDWLFDHHPDWEWWNNFWDKVSPYYGDPLCYLYCTKIGGWAWGYVIEHERIDY